MIMQSNDTPFSSDELVLNVGVDDNVQDKIVNPWGDTFCWTLILILIAAQHVNPLL